MLEKIVDALGDWTENQIEDLGLPDWMENALIELCDLLTETERSDPKTVKIFAILGLMNSRLENIEYYLKQLVDRE